MNVTVKEPFQEIIEGWVERSETQQTLQGGIWLRLYPLYEVFRKSFTVTLMQPPFHHEA